MRKRKILNVICPTCGEIGELAKYSDKTFSVHHNQVFSNYPFPHYNVGKSCYHIDWNLLKTIKYINI